LAGGVRKSFLRVCDSYYEIVIMRYNDFAY